MAKFNLQIPHYVRVALDAAQKELGARYRAPTGVKASVVGDIPATETDPGRSARVLVYVPNKIRVEVRLVSYWSGFGQKEEDWMVSNVFVRDHYAEEAARRAAETFGPDHPAWGLPEELMPE